MNKGGGRRRYRPGPGGMDSTLRKIPIGELSRCGVGGSAAAGIAAAGFVREEVRSAVASCTWHFALGLPLEDKLIEALEEVGCDHCKAPLLIRSFETADLKYLRRKTPLRLIQLIDASGVGPDGWLTYAPPHDRPYDRTITGEERGFADLVTPQGLPAIAEYADGVGPWKRHIVGLRGTVSSGQAGDVDDDDSFSEVRRQLSEATELIRNPHNAGLLEHPYPLVMSCGS